MTKGMRVANGGVCGVVEVCVQRAPILFTKLRNRITRKLVTII